MMAQILTKSCICKDKPVCVQLPTPADNVTLHTFADERRVTVCRAAGHLTAATIDQYLLPAGCIAANRPQWWEVAEWWDGRYCLPAGHPAANPPHAAAAVIDGTDRQMDVIPLHRPSHIQCEHCRYWKVVAMLTVDVDEMLVCPSWLTGAQERNVTVVQRRAVVPHHPPSTACQRHLCTRAKPTQSIN